MSGKFFFLFPYLVGIGERKLESEKIGRLTQLSTKRKENMSKKLYVGGLSYDTTDDSLKAKFSEAGSVASASVVMDKMAGRSRGFGFVEFVNDADADKAIEMFNDKDFEGRKITVNVARPKEDRPRDGGGFGGRGGFSGGRDGRW